jgi:hypothetical protein
MCARTLCYFALRADISGVYYRGGQANTRYLQRKGASTSIQCDTARKNAGRRQKFAGHKDFRTILNYIHFEDEILTTWV